MLPNGEYVTSTTTEELLQLTDGMTNQSVSFMVTEASELKTSKNGFPYMQVFGENDEEEPLKLSIWGKAATEKFHSLIKPGALYKFTGVKIVATKPQFLYGHLPFDLNLYDWGNLLRGDYKPRGLQLKAPADINPSTDWRIRCRGVIVQNFTRYMRYGSALMGMIRVRHDLQFQVTLRSVPMAHINSFNRDTELELIGHISRNGSVWDFDVMKWADVRHNSSIERNVISVPASKTDASPVEKTPPTPQMLLASKFDFGQSAAAHSACSAAQHGRPPASNGSASLQQNDGVPQTPTSTFACFHVDLLGTVVQEPRWDETGKYFCMLVSVAHGGKPKAVSVVSAKMLATVAKDLKRGSKVYLTGEIVNKRTGCTMDADEVQPEDSFLSKAQKTSLPSAFSNAEDIYGHTVQWHKIHADIFSEVTFDDETNTYNCFVIVHDSAKTIQLELCDVPHEAVPQLTMFTELILIGIISGDEDALQMCVAWENASFVKAHENSTDSISLNIATATTDDIQTQRRSNAEIQVVGEFTPSSAALQVTTPTRVPQVDLSKVKREHAEGMPADKPGNPRRRPLPKTERAATQNAKKPKNDAETTMNGGETPASNNSAAVPCDQTSVGGSSLSPGAFLANSVESEAAEDDIPDKSCTE